MMWVLWEGLIKGLSDAGLPSESTEKMVSVLGGQGR